MFTIMPSMKVATDSTSLNKMLQEQSNKLDDIMQNHCSK